MIIFLYGQDTYRARQKLNEIIESYKKIHQSGLNLRYLDFSEKQLKDDYFLDFKDQAQQVSMFKEKKLLVAIDPFSSSEFKNVFLEQKQNFLKSEDIMVLFEKADVDKRDSLFKFLKKEAKCQEFTPLKGIKLKKWVKKEFEKNETQIEPWALEKLIDYVGNDLWRLSNEIGKLINFRKNQQIRIKDIELLVRSGIETDIFKTIDALAQKNKKQALKCLHKHIEKGDSALYLFSMINYQFRNLLLIKDFIEKGKPYNIIARESGLHPFVVKKNYYQSYKFSFSEIKKIYQKIFEVDKDIKTGKIEPETALDLLVAEI